ncbi:hypothetical protein DM01DRAFT_324781 [Hesseltinella vesiculosa]|uniref:SEC63 domain-containing protein n=1 Tax=Hesseltinella vesiculosa TaxID=101127 RepID=A0A1X2GRL4_9FUNG|nr:hypothetical protein DM01DRAFT_324781 [Hesseltinella vesiculosa]
MNAMVWSVGSDELKQLEGVGPKIASDLKNHGIATINELRKVDALRLESMFHRNPPFGTKIKSQVASIPHYSLQVNQKCDAALAVLWLTVNLTLSSPLKNAPTDPLAKGYATCIWIEAGDDHTILNFQRKPTKLLNDTELQFTYVCSVNDPNVPLIVHVQNEDFVGIDLLEKVYPGEYHMDFLEEAPVTNVSASFTTQDMMDPGQATPSPQPSTRAKTSKRLPPCKHTCKDKRKCKHKCCHREFEDVNKAYPRVTLEHQQTQPKSDKAKAADADNLILPPRRRLLDRLKSSGTEPGPSMQPKSSVSPKNDNRHTALCSMSPTNLSQLNALPAFLHEPYSSSPSSLLHQPQQQNVPSVSSPQHVSSTKHTLAEDDISDGISNWICDSDLSWLTSDSLPSMTSHTGQLEPTVLSPNVSAPASTAPPGAAYEPMLCSSSHSIFCELGDMPTISSNPMFSAAPSIPDGLLAAMGGEQSLDVDFSSLASFPSLDTNLMLHLSTNNALSSSPSIYAFPLVDETGLSVLADAAAVVSPMTPMFVPRPPLTMSPPGYATPMMPSWIPEDFSSSTPANQTSNTGLPVYPSQQQQDPPPSIDFASQPLFNTQWSLSPGPPSTTSPTSNQFYQPPLPSDPSPLPLVNLTIPLEGLDDMEYLFTSPFQRIVVIITIFFSLMAAPMAGPMTTSQTTSQTTQRIARATNTAVRIKCSSHAAKQVTNEFKLTFCIRALV